MSFEPELDKDLFEDDCDCEGDCLCEDFDEDALDDDELEDLEDEWEEE